MKKIIFTINIAMMFGLISVEAQDTMYVHQKTGGIIKIAVNNVDSVVFYDKTTSPGGITITDKDGNVYNTVTIGTQTWMKENLKVTKYNDGTAIPLVTDITAWGSLSTPGYCWFNNDQTTYGSTYGALYNWHTVNTGKLCPTGWHVPTDTEWTTLTNYLGGIYVAGGKLKEVGITHWESPNDGATNETGFTALPTFSRNYSGPFNEQNEYGFWWASTESNATQAWHRYLQWNAPLFISQATYKEGGLSIRCLRD